jgi:hypothetical protein
MNGNNEDIANLIPEPEFEPGAESLLDSFDANEELIHKEVNRSLLGMDRPTIAGRRLRPIKLSTLTLLQESGNEIISGKMVKDCQNIVMDTCRFIVLQSVPLRRAVELVKDKEELKWLAMEVADDISPSDVPKIVDEVIRLVNEAQEGRVEPIIDNSGKKETSEEITSVLAGES